MERLCVTYYNKKNLVALKLRHQHLHVQNFLHFAHLKPIFSILHIYFYKTPTSVYLFYTFIQQNIHSFTFLLLLSHSWPLSLSDPTTVIITQPPLSRNPDQFTCVVLFLFSFSWLIRAETQTHSTRNPRLIGAKVVKVD